MKAFAVLLDSRPEYLRDAQGPESLLMPPLGRATILRHLSEALASAGHSRLTIATAFAPEPDYERRIEEHGTQVEAIVPIRELAGRIAEYEPSDWLMIVDPSCFPSNGLELGALSLGNNGNGGLHGARHLVVLDSHPGGTTERIQVDANGAVRRIQRYYDSATWPFTSGVACSLLPVSCTLGASELPFGSLRDLRQKLAEHGVPSSDILLEAGAFDLSYERDLLGLSERFVLDHFSGRRAGEHGWLDIGPGCQIDPSARLLGPIVLHHGASIGPDATVVGPAVIGAGARVERDAMVAQCVVGAGSVVPAGSTLRHRVVFGAAGQSGSAAAPAPLYEAASALPVDSPEANDDRTAATAVYGMFKAAFDVIAAALGLALLSPLLLLTAVLIKLESKGPVFYRDEREGRGGRLFGCLKFRSMFAGAEAHQRALMAKNQVDGPQFKMARDPRVTRLGRVLR